MFSEFTGSKSIARIAPTILLTLSFFNMPVIAQRMSEGVLLTSPFGLARDQSLRFTLFLSSGEPVRARVALFDAGGNSVAESGEASISAGQFHSFDFTPSDIHQSGEDRTGRRQLHASCFIPGTGPFTRIVDGLAASVEVIKDGLSNTLLVAENVFQSGRVNGNPDLTSDFNTDFLFGIVPDETFRVSVFNPLSPEDGRNNNMQFTVTITDADGAVIARTGDIALAPGLFQSVDFTLSELPLPTDPVTGRAQVHGHIRHRFFSVVDRTQLAPDSLEIIDVLGRTTIGFGGSVWVASSDVNN